MAAGGKSIRPVQRTRESGARAQIYRQSCIISGAGIGEHWNYCVCAYWRASGWASAVSRSCRARGGQLLATRRRRKQTVAATQDAAHAHLLSATNFFWTVNGICKRRCHCPEIAHCYGFNEPLCRKKKFRVRTTPGKMFYTCAKIFFCLAALIFLSRSFNNS